MSHKIRLTLLISAMIVLHQDFWFWRATHPLLFGFLPPGLWYHILYSLAAAATLWTVVKLAWAGDEESGS